MDPFQITIQMPIKSATAKASRELDGKTTEDGRTILFVEQGDTLYCVLSAPGTSKKKALEFVKGLAERKTAGHAEPEPEVTSVPITVDDSQDEDDEFGVTF